MRTEWIRDKTLSSSKWWQYGFLTVGFFDIENGVISLYIHRMS